MLTEHALFNALGFWDRISHHVAEARDLTRKKDIVGNAQPDFVFHLAAQAIVSACYSARDGELQAFYHGGFWKCMDALRDKGDLTRCGSPAVQSGKRGKRVSLLEVDHGARHALH